MYFRWLECTFVCGFSIWTNLSKLLNSLQFCDATHKNLPEELEKCKFINVEAACSLEPLSPSLNFQVVVFVVEWFFNKITIQGTPQMAADKEAISLSRVYSCYSNCNLLLF